MRAGTLSSSASSNLQRPCVSASGRPGSLWTTPGRLFSRDSRSAHRCCCHHRQSLDDRLHGRHGGRTPAPGLQRGIKEKSGFHRQRAGQPRVRPDSFSQRYPPTAHFDRSDGHNADHEIWVPPMVDDFATSRAFGAVLSGGPTAYASEHAFGPHTPGGFSPTADLRDLPSASCI